MNDFKSMVEKIYFIWQREIKSYFVSPVAYIILAASAVMYALFFREMVQASAIGDPYSGDKAPINQIFPVSYGNFMMILAFSTPFITMRLLSEEKKLGTMELLMTSPLKPAEIVLGKFFAALTLICMTLAVTVIQSSTVLLLDVPNLSGGIATLIGLFFLSSTLVAIGLMVSNFTENQIISGMVSFGIVLVIYITSFAFQASSGLLADIVKELSIISHFRSFTMGILDLRHIGFFTLFTTFCLYVTIKSFDLRRIKG